MISLGVGLVFSFVLGLVRARPARAQDPAGPTEPAVPEKPGKALRAFRITGSSPQIDGRLDEEVWAAADAIDDLVRIEPDNVGTDTRKSWQVFMNVSGGREEEGGWNARIGPNLRLQPGLFEDLRLQGQCGVRVANDGGHEVWSLEIMKRVLGIAARQFWIRAPGHGEIVRAELPPRQEDQVLVRTLYSGISRGTESLVFRGEVPPSQYEAMRAPFQEGEFPGPIKYGYTSVGEVQEGGDHLAGRTVFCLYPHQDLYCVPASGVTPLPDDVPSGRAVLAANMETALNAVWDARPAAGDRIVVIGAGVVGLLIAWLCRQMPGTRVTAVDINSARAAVARELGVSFVGEPPEDAAADLVVHASGQPEGLASALAVAGVEATVLEVSWYGSRAVPLPLGEAFHSRRLSIKSSQVGRVNPDRAPRWTTARRLGLALELLRDPRLDALITGESEFEDLPEVLAKLSRDPGDALCHRIRYSTS